LDDGRTQSSNASILVVLVALNHNQDNVVGHIEHWAVAVAEGLAGLVVSVPDEAEADV
jgi:hypothetical protein